MVSSFLVSGVLTIRLVELVVAVTFRVRSWPLLSVVWLMTVRTMLKLALVTLKFMVTL